MGLDMYLYAKKYEGNWAFEKKQNANYLAIKELYPDVKVSENASAIEVTITVGYWRKANAIHNWFVKNVQGGEDDCGNYYVSRDNLVELRKECDKVLKNELMLSVLTDSNSSDILPPVAGFFFGNDERDEWYFNSVKYTVELIDGLLESIPEDDFTWSFTYHSSW